MATKAEQALEIYKQHEGKEEGTGAWHTVDQEQINKFADATLDHQFIHVDPERAAQHSPFGTTIAHGYLTLSLIPYLTASISPLDPKSREGVVMGINYGLDKVRFPAPVKVDSKVRARQVLASADLKDPNTIQLKYQVTVEVDGQDKPGCVAEVLVRLIYQG